jgi:hypothetical protein
LLIGVENMRLGRQSQQIQAIEDLSKLRSRSSLSCAKHVCFSPTTELAGYGAV